MKCWKSVLLFVISTLLTLLVLYNVSCRKNEIDKPSGTDSTKYSISGKITDSTNNVITDVTITLSGPVSDTVKPDADGNYLFSGLAKGDYILKPSKTEYSFTPISRPVKINNAKITGQDPEASEGKVLGLADGAGGRTAEEAGGKGFVRGLWHGRTPRSGYDFRLALRKP